MDQVVENLFLGLRSDALVGVVPKKELDIAVVGVHEDMRHREVAGSVVVWDDALEGLDEVVYGCDVLNAKLLGTEG